MAKNNKVKFRRRLTREELFPKKLGADKEILAMEAAINRAFDTPEERTNYIKMLHDKLGEGLEDD